LSTPQGAQRSLYGPSTPAASSTSPSWREREGSLRGHGILQDLIQEHREEAHRIDRVLNACALLAWMESGPGADHVRASPLLDQAADGGIRRFIFIVSGRRLPLTGKAGLEGLG